MITIMFYTTVIILIVCICYVYLKRLSGSKVWTRAYGDKQEDIETLLNRIQWANNFRSQLRIPLRHLFISLIISLCVLTLMCDGAPSIPDYVRTVFVMFVLLQAFYNFSQFHCEKFPHYAIDRNVRLIRKRCGIRRSKLPPQSRIQKFPVVSACYNYTYSNIEF